MTPDQIRLVQDSFRHVALVREAAAKLFYEHLFAIDPSLRTLFASTDMQRQGTKLIATLGFVVHQLDRVETIFPVARDLGKRHVHYGVEERHYKAVERALIETLAAMLGSAFTPQLREAWHEAIAELTGVMIEAARQAAAVA